MSSKVDSAISTPSQDIPSDQSNYEEYLSNNSTITVEDIEQLNQPTSNYLVPRDANKYGIFFTRFSLRDEESNKPILDIKLSEEEIENYPKISEQSTDPSFGRFIKFQLPSQFLEMKYIGATIDFKVGKDPVQAFRMIEKHYFKSQLLKQFDFMFPFCMPNSRNSCAQIYEVPELSQDLRALMVETPYITKSDSFYFVQNRLVMHHKAEYAFNIA